MKPLPVARWTAEDTDIWVNVLERQGLYWYATSLECFQGQDRRDAQLMYLARLCRAENRVETVWWYDGQAYGLYSYLLWETLPKGAEPCGGLLDITNFA